jgi:nucleoside-diphosphate-sugar epimerase
VKALELCASVPDAAGEVYFVAGDTIVTIEDMVRQISHIQGVRTSIVRLPMTAGLAGGYLLEKVAPLMRRPPPLTRRSFDFFRINNAYNIDKARHQLGFRPEIDLQAGLDKTYESLRRTEAFI